MTHTTPLHPFSIDMDESTEEEDMMEEQTWNSPTKPKLQRCNATLNAYTCQELPISVIHLHEQRLHQISQKLKSHPNMYENWNLFLQNPSAWHDQTKSWPKSLKDEVHCIYRIWQESYREQFFDCVFFEPFVESQ